MLTISYYTAIPADGFREMITMLSSGDYEADMADMATAVNEAGWTRGALVSKWVSHTWGDERHPDGKDKYRRHVRQWVKAIQYQATTRPAPSIPIAHRPGEARGFA